MKFHDILKFIHANQLIRDIVLETDPERAEEGMDVFDQLYEGDNPPFSILQNANPVNISAQVQFRKETFSVLRRQVDPYLGASANMYLFRRAHDIDNPNQKICLYDGFAHRIGGKLQEVPISNFHLYPGNGRILSGMDLSKVCLLYTSPSPRDQRGSRMPSSA